MRARSKLFREDETKGVVVAALPSRAKRPTVYKKRGCPFCPGNESLTPPTTFALPSEKDWRTRCFENAFPIMKGTNGRHEVIVETPRHNKLFQDLGDKQLGLVFETYKNRFLALQKNKDFVFLFKNHGRASGASIEHEHSQIISLPFVPDLTQKELAFFAAFKRKRGKCFYCTLAKRERVLLKTKHFAVVVPRFARFPCETWVVPKKCVNSFTEFSEAEALDFMRVLRDVVRRVYGYAKDYTIAFHNAPRGARFHFHAEIYPRPNVWGGIELGTGLIINPKDGKQALKTLKH